MHSPEALILRRCYPVPVTFKDLRLAADLGGVVPTPSTRFVEASGVGCPNIRRSWTAAMKEVTGALDEVYAVVDGREVRVVANVTDTTDVVHENFVRTDDIWTLLDTADRDGYWARPHEVRLVLQERPVSTRTVALAVLVGQEYAERHGGAR